MLLVVEYSPANTGHLKDEGLIPGLGRSHGGRLGTYSSILVQRISWTEEPGRLYIAHGVAKSQTRLK